MNPMDSAEELISQGLQVRRKVLGDEFVNAALAGADEFSRPLQELVSGCAWGAVWGRDDLPLKTRSMLTVAMLIALNRPHELETHLRGAINNGVTEVELREVLLHSIPYCGFPAAVDAFRTARKILAATPKAE